MKKNIILNLALSILLMTFIITLFPMVTKNKIPKELSPVSTLIDDINLSNKYVFDVSDNDLSNPEISMRVLSAIDDLNAIKDKISSIDVPEKYSDLVSNLSNGINSNILFYRQFAAILNNLKGKDLDESKENLKNYENAAYEAYSKISPFKVYFFNGSNEKLSSLYKSIDSIRMSNRNEQIKEESNKTFIMSFEKIITDFSSINKDFSPYIEKWRNSSYSYNSLITDLDKCQTSLDNLSRNIYALSIPSEASQIYEDFKQVIASYRDYLNAVQLDLSKSTLNSKEEKFFENSSSKREAANSALEKFKQSLDDYKDNLSL